MLRAYLIVNPLCPSDIALAEASFRKINRHADEAAALFFTRLYEFDPVLRTVAAADHTTRKREFIRLLGTIVHRLDCLDLLRDHVRELASPHSTLVAAEEHHHSVGAAFFWMLEQVLGTDFTPAVYAAWMSIFRLLSADIKASSQEFALAS